jgi:hypothetical protein
MWSINEFASTQVRMRASDGYLSATDMCRVDPKKNWSHYRETKQSQEFIAVLAERVNNDQPGQPTIKLVESITANSPYRGTWVHPRIATHLALWISPAFGVSVTGWVEAWVNISNSNRVEYFKEISSLVPRRSVQREKAIQRALHARHGGSIEVATSYGFIDLVYSKCIVEIKEASKWKHALGQILCYGIEYPSYQKVIVLFDNIKDIDQIRRAFSRFDIELRVHDG